MPTRRGIGSKIGNFFKDAGKVVLTGLTARGRLANKVVGTMPKNADPFGGLKVLGVVKSKKPHTKHKTKTHHTKTGKLGKGDIGPVPPSRRSHHTKTHHHKTKPKAKKKK